MPKPQRPWFRFYVEAIYDRKLRRLTPAQRWLWVVVLAAARQSKMPGVLIDVHTSDLADMAAMPEREVKKAMPIFEGANMLDRDGESWSVTNWKERQYESDTSMLRMAKHRHNVVTNAVTVTPPEAEADTDKASSNTYTHDPPVENSTAALIDKALKTIADRRITASNGRVSNVSAYKATVIAALRQEHHKQLAQLARDPVIANGQWTADDVANLLEPDTKPQPTNFAPGSGRIPNWSAGET